MTYLLLIGLTLAVSRALATVLPRLPPRVLGHSIGWKVTEQILLLLLLPGESCLEGLAGGRQLNHWAWIWVGLGREPALVGLKKGQEEDEGVDRDLALLLVPHLRHRRDRGQEAEQWFGKGHQHSDRLEVG